MYKKSYANGDKWFEFIKLRPAVYSVYRINGDGSHDTMQDLGKKSLAKKYCQFLNDNYATDGGRLKVFEMSDGDEFLSKATYNKLNHDDEGFPLCPVYKAKVLPDERDLCSLCSRHSASVTWDGGWATLEQLKITNNTPF